MIAEVLKFLTKWSPYIWMFGSIFGVTMSGALLKRAWEQRVLQKAIDGDLHPTTAFWFRHALWFFLLHAGFLFIGFIAVLRLTSPWASLVTLLFLVTTPLVLVFRSYDSLRLQSKLRTDANP